MRVDAVRNRQQIVEAARELVARDGDAVRMDALAARAGVAVGTLYRHFPTKSDLIGAVVEESTRALAVRAEDALDQVRLGASAWSQLEGLFASIAQGYSAHRAVVTTAALLELGSAEDPEGSAARAVAAMGAMVAAAQRAGDMRTDVDLADLLMLLGQAPERDDDRRARYIALVSDGLRPRPPASS
ncbi:TetR/AcrR family transcriptional regulator [Actinomycetospora sp. TBRC 11914]|uniref:TetR/AcrR family transcriptional regulator n=1 Tax=Actinomycetospora sp. TBRC 11914 TaxID=2729387 RepID=UPI00145D3A5B|nr:helix-turn-helix domain-containing protein [Actinomycetospora sp. TBRC 11914]NMO88252.1 helix-turn-helix transcriptional regulator [Actinomycetospora sp. TBRC 11914]